MEKSIVIISEHGAEISITNRKVLIKEPDRYHPIVGDIPGDLIELNLFDIHEITRILQEKFGIDISKADFKRQCDVKNI